MGAAGGEYIDIPDHSGSSQHVLLVIGDVPSERVQSFCIENGMTHFVRVTYNQSCRDRYELADFMNEADGNDRADEETVRKYFQILTGYTYEVIAMALADEPSWDDEDNMFLNGPDAPFLDLPTGVYREPQMLVVGPVTEPCIEVVRN